MMDQRLPWEHVGRTPHPGEGMERGLDWRDV